VRTPFPISDAALARRLARPGYPRSAAYDPWWVVDNLMGPQPLWLAESLTQLRAPAAGARVLDLGCGRALTSIFLAHEFGVEVTAADLWIPAEDNQLRIEAAGMAESVVPVWAEAHALPFEAESFDAIVSIDAYQYFGTDDLYLAYLARFLRPGGVLGIVVPGLAAEIEEVPEHLRPWWESDYWCFHSPAWWRRHWERSGVVRVLEADQVADGWRLWLEWLQVCLSLQVPPLFPGHDGGIGEAAMLEADAGRNLGFTRLLAVKR
jgi:SAM-dependent methyltransferase